MAKRLLIAFFGLVMVVSACGDDGDSGLSGDEQAFADAVADFLVADPDPSNPFADRTSALCFTETVVAEIGLDALVEAGLTVENFDDPNFELLDEDHLDAFADAALGCVDLSAVFTEPFEQAGIGSESIQCLADEMEQSGLLKTAFIAGMSGDESLDPSSNPETMEQLLAIMLDCFSAEDLLKLGDL